MKKAFTLVHVLIAIALLAVIISALCGCTRIEQTRKQLQGEFTGIPRRIELYSFNGEKLKEYQGNQTLIDFKENNTIILVDGKRVIATNVIVISEEIQ